MDEVILTLSYIPSKGALGAAAFSDGNLQIMEDALALKGASVFDVVATVIRQLQPTVLLVNAKSGEEFVEFVRTLQGSVEIRPSNEFSFKTARNRVLALKVHPDFLREMRAEGVEIFFDGAQDTDKTALALYLESLASLNNEQMVGCIGAMMQYFVRSQGLRNDDAESIYSIRKIENFHANGFMNLNQDAYNSLNIFCDERHPNMFSSDSKEGLSLFGLMNMTRSNLAKTLLTQWFLRPSIDIQVIRSRQAAVKQFILSRNLDRVDSMRQSVAFVPNMTRLHQKLSKKLSVQEWQSIVKFSYNAFNIRLLCDQLDAPTTPILQKIRQTFNPHRLQEVAAEISKVIDFDASASETRIIVKQGVDEGLDELKRLFDGLPDLLNTVATDIAKIFPAEFSDSMTVMYFPQLGYLITVPLEGRTSQESFLVDGLDFQFCTAKSVFYKSSQMYELDENIGDLHSIIADKEIAMIQQLQTFVSTFFDLLVDVSHTCSELDCLLALAEAAMKYSWVCPEMVESGMLEIVDGRHPLYEQCMDSFIGNYTGFGGGKGRGDSVEQGYSESNITEVGGDESSSSLRLMVLTGPNFSGKSVYLKQVGLIVFMAHIGSFVPAKSATVSITDRIITRIQAIESDSKIQSAFMIDSQQVAYALRNATSKSLILIDEYGKGTLPANGIGLFCACLENFLQRNDECPKVVATTHFHEIFMYDLLPKHDALGWFKMDVFQGSLADQERLTFLYRVVPGTTGSSLGLHCAQLSGVPDAVLERAAEISRKLKSGATLMQENRIPEATRNQLMIQDVVEYFKRFDCERGELSELWEQVRSCEIAFER